MFCCEKGCFFGLEVGSMSLVPGMDQINQHEFPNAACILDIVQFGNPLINPCTVKPIRFEASRDETLLCTAEKELSQSLMSYQINVYGDAAIY